MTRKVNAATLAHIKASEGLRLKSYPDPGSRDGTPWTIGFGSTSNVNKGMVITEAQAEARLVQDLTTAENVVERLVKVPLNDNQFGALVDFAFNVGEGQFKGSTLLRKLNAGDYASVPSELAKWRFNDGKEMAGLVTRRKNTAKLWSTPAGTKPTVTSPPAAPLPIPSTPAPTPAKPGLAPIWIIAAIVVVLVGLVLFTPIFN